MKRFLFALPVILLLGLIFFYLSFKADLKKKSSSLVYNTEISKWETVEEAPRIEAEEVDKNDNEDGLHNQSVLKGYFDRYDQEKDELVVKYTLPFTMDRQHKVINLKTSPNKITYCTANTITEEKTGKETLTKDLDFIVKNNQTLVTSKEKVIDFEKFIAKADEKTFLFIQLTKDFNKNETNYIKKLVVVGLCD